MIVLLVGFGAIMLSLASMMVVYRSVHQKIDQI